MKNLLLFYVVWFFLSFFLMFLVHRCVWYKTMDKISREQRWRCVCVWYKTMDNFARERLLAGAAARVVAETIFVCVELMI